MNDVFVRMGVQGMGAVESLKAAPARAGRTLRRLVKDERAVSVIEYAILLGVIVGAVTLAVTQFGGQISNAVNTIANNVTATVSTVGGT